MLVGYELFLLLNNDHSNPGSETSETAGSSHCVTSFSAQNSELGSLNHSSGFRTC